MGGSVKCSAPMAIMCISFLSCVAATYFVVNKFPVFPIWTIEVIIFAPFGEKAPLVIMIVHNNLLGLHGLGLTLAHLTVSQAVGLLARYES